MLKTFLLPLDLERDYYNLTSLAFWINTMDTNVVEVTFDITQDSAKVDLTDALVQMAIQKPSGLTVYQDCEIVDAAAGVGKITLNNQAYNEFGTYRGEVILRQGDQVAVTCPFYYGVKNAILNDETLESTNDWSALLAALMEYDKKPLLVDGIPAATPEYIGQMAFDTTGQRAFIANGLAAEDWQLLAAGEGGGGSIVAWADILGKPITFPPSSHVHLMADITDLQAALDEKADVGAVGGSVDWTDVLNKPTTFAPSTHSHSITDVTGLQGALDGKADDSDLAAKADLNHTHTYATITNKPTTFPPEAHTQDWGTITGKPTTFTPATHTHDFTTGITGKPATYPSDWSTTANKPTTFTPATHSHLIADVTGLQAALNGKADDNDLAAYFTKTESDLRYEPIGGVAATSWGDITGTLADQADLQAALNSKSNVPSSGAADPTGAPLYIGQLYINTTSGEAFIATTMAGGWQSISMDELGGGAGSVDWGAITGKPDTFPPSAHTHLWADITDKPTTFMPPLMSGAAVGGAQVGNGLAMSGNYLFVKTLAADGTKIDTVNNAIAIDRTTVDTWYASLNHSHAYSTLTGIPTTFAPSAHTHDWTADIIGKPATYAPSAHTHAATEITEDATHRFTTDAEKTTWNAKAPLASPTFTGTPIAPTPAVDDNTTKIATTAFVKGQGYLTSAPVTSVNTKTGAVSITAADVGLGNVTNESKATMFTNAALTGNPTAPTPATADSDTSIATTAFVKAQGYLTAAPVTSVNTKTGAVTVTAADVGLGNVTNESKATMFTNPTFTGTATAATLNATANLQEAGTNLAAKYAPISGSANYATKATETTVAQHTTQLAGLTLWKGTQAAYDALTKDANTLYFISG